MRGFHALATRDAARVRPGPDLRLTDCTTPARILVIEGHPLLARALRQALEEEGYCVTVAAMASVGLGSDTPYDLVLLDHPGPPAAADGLVAAWRGLGITTPVLLLGDPPAGTTVEPRFEAADRLSKPFALAELFERVEALIDNR